MWGASALGLSVKQTGKRKVKRLGIKLMGAYISLGAGCSDLRDAPNLSWPCHRSWSLVLWECARLCSSPCLFTLLISASPSISLALSRASRPPAATALTPVVATPSQYEAKPYAAVRGNRYDCYFALQAGSWPSLHSSSKDRLWCATFQTQVLSVKVFGL